jgi:hypothetical protein
MYHYLVSKEVSCIFTILNFECKKLTGTRANIWLEIGRNLAKLVLTLFAIINLFHNRIESYIAIVFFVKGKAA